MRIQNTNSVGKAKARKTGGTRSGGAAFAIPSGQTTETQATTGAVAAGPIVAVDALIALQEDSDPKRAKKRAVQQATDILDLLDGIKIGLLEGRVPQSRLQQLVSVVEQQRGQFHDDRLTAVLDEVELRARVELAKFGTTAR